MTPEAHPLLAHVSSLTSALERLPEQVLTLERWGRELARVLSGGGRLLAVGNGGSAAQAQHLTAELVGRYLDDRRPFSAIALHAETSSLTAIVNDYGVAEAFARQVRAHGRPGDVLLCLSTSGRSENVLAAARAATESGLVTWALTGPRGNPLAGIVDDSITVESNTTCTIQEVHLVLAHLICEAVERHLDLPEDAAALRSANGVDLRPAAGGAA